MSSHAQPLVPARSAVSLAWPAALALAALMGIGRFAFTPVWPLMAHDAALAGTRRLAGLGQLRGLPAGRADRGRVAAAPAAGRAGRQPAGGGGADPGHAPAPLCGGLGRAAAGGRLGQRAGLHLRGLMAARAGGRPDRAGRVRRGLCGRGRRHRGDRAGLPGPDGGRRHGGAMLDGAGRAGAGLVDGRLAQTARALPATAASARPSDREPLPRGMAGLALHYGVFGIGYIIPATFLPAMAATSCPIRRCSAGPGPCSDWPPRCPA